MKPSNLFNVLAVSMAFCIASCGNMNTKPDNSAVAEKNKESMKKVFEMFQTGNSQGIENYVSENHVDHNPPPDIKSTGVQELKDIIAMHHGAFPDSKMTILSMVAEGDMVIAHFNMKGTNTGAMGNMPATNKTIDVNGVDIVRFADGKGVEHWGYWEEAKMMTQLGMMPDMSQANATAANEAQPSPADKK
jgi:steroid delta-isomerase-like uncharacterized protein